MSDAGHTPILEAANQCASLLWDELPSRNPRLLLVHYLIGTSDSPYALRRSAIRIFSPFLEALSGGSEAVPDKHAQAFADYISYFDRDNTFLDYIIDDKELKFVPGEIHTWQLSVRSDIAAPIQRLAEGTHTRLEIRSDVPDALVHPDAVTHFFSALYQRSIWKTTWADLFALARMRLLKDFPASAIKQSDAEAVVSEGRTHLKTLAGIQAALLYFRAVEPNREELSCSVIAVPVQHAKETGAARLSLGIAIISPALSQSGLSTSKARIAERFQAQYAAINFETLESDGQPPTSFPFIRTKRMTKLEKDEFQNQITAVFRARFQKYTAAYFGYWLLLLLEKLTGAVHEGRPLDFFLVCGDQSEFEDRTLLRRFSKPITRLSVPDNPARQPNIFEKAQKAADWLAKEHYPWFESGRHALFWDVSSKNRSPSALVKLRASNWYQLVQDRTLGTTHIGVPSCVVFYSLGSKAVSGVFKVEPLPIQERTALPAKGPRLMDGQMEGAKITELLRRNFDKWIIFREERERDLEAILKFSLGDIVETGTLNNLRKLTLRLAQDLGRGGTIILLKEGATIPFRTMGRPFEIDPIFEDDRLALIAHDGASQHDGKTTWVHRSYLTSDGIAPPVIDALFDKAGKADSGEMEFPLSLKGSRRWSAAIASFHPKVYVAVVISEDGDVHIWQVTDKGKTAFSPNETFVFELSRTHSRAQKFNFKKGKYEDFKVPTPLPS